MAEYVEEGAELGRKGRGRNCHVAANGNLMALILADDAMRLKPIAITAPANIIQKKMKIIRSTAASTAITWMTMKGESK